MKLRTSIAASLIFSFASTGLTQIPKTIVENVPISEKTITGAPFSADAVTESVQLLADGNRIIHRASSKLYRDNEGRFRREDGLKQLGLPGENIEVSESILIVDPVAGVRYVVNTKNSSFKQSSFRADPDSGKRFKLAGPPGTLLENFTRQFNLMAEQSVNIETQAESSAQQTMESSAQGDSESRRKDRGVRTKAIEPSSPGPDERGKSGQTSKTEALGVRRFDGVSADGVRTTTTIPAGAIGNERAINIVYEKWYSNDLQMTVLSQHTDPRFGEQSYRLSNIKRENPPITLFSPPEGYRRKGDKDFQIKPPRIEVKPPAPSWPKPSAPSSPKPPAPSWPKPPAPSWPNPPAPPRPGEPGRKPEKPNL
jgi:hypothetical protein